MVGVNFDINIKPQTKEEYDKLISSIRNVDPKKLEEVRKKIKDEKNKKEMKERVN